MPQQLSGMDATFLAAESDRAFMHGLGIVRLVAGTGPRLTRDELTELITRRLDRLEPLRRQLVPVPGGLDQPWWIRVTPKVDQHLSHVVLPGDEPDELEELCAVITATPLGRDRPMWHIWLVDGLPGDAQALLFKMHHSVSDGVGAMVIISNILDTERVGRDGDGERPEGDEEEPSPAWLVTRAAARHWHLPIDLARTGVEIGNSLARIARLGLGSHADMAVPLVTPHLEMNGTVSARRTVALRELSLAEVKSVAHTAAVHVNDVILAVVAGGLRRWLDDHGDLHDQPLVAAVPVSVRTPEELNAAGNKVSACFVHLATHIADPVERLRWAADAATGAKAAQVALGAHTFEHLASLVDPNLVGAGMALYNGLRLSRAHPPAVNVIVSNVAGPSWPFYLAGRDVESLAALGPIFDGVPLNLTAVSYQDRLSLAFVACPKLVPDLDALAGATEECLDDLVRAIALDL